MADQEIKHTALDFRKGEETTRLEYGAAFAWQSMLNARVDRAALERRKGMVLLSATTTTAVTGDFVAASSKVVTLPASAMTTAGVFPLGTQWTVEALCNPDLLTGDHYILGGSANDDGLLIKITSGGVVTAVVTDSASNVTTLTAGTFSTGSTIGIQVKRSGASLTLTVPGATDTDTMSASNLLHAQTGAFIGGHNGGSYFDGAIEHVRCYRVAKPNVIDLYCRQLDPRKPSCVFDYVVEKDSNGEVPDRGPLGLSASTNLAATRSSIAVNHAPILGMAANRNTSGQPKLYYWAGNRLLQATL